MIDFWIDFLPKLAPFWDPSWDPRAAQDGPKTPPQNFFKLSKTPPGQLKRHKSIQDRNLVHFWSQNPMEYPPRASIFEVIFVSIFSLPLCSQQFFLQNSSSCVIVLGKSRKLGIVWLFVRKKDSETPRASRLPSLRSFTEY